MTWFNSRLNSPATLKAIMPSQRHAHHMELLDRLLGHDAWMTRELLLICQQLDDRQLDFQFGIGHRSVRATPLHLIRNVEVN